MNERHEKALALREGGMTYKAIGVELGCGVERARQMVLSAKRGRAKAAIAGGTILELSVRAFNALKNAGFGKDTTHTEIAARLSEIRRGRIKNFGKRSLQEVEQWLSSHGHDI